MRVRFRVGFRVRFRFRVRVRVRVSVRVRVRVRDLGHELESLRITWKLDLQDIFRHDKA